MAPYDFKLTNIFPRLETPTEVDGLACNKCGHYGQCYCRCVKVQEKLEQESNYTSKNKGFDVCGSRNIDNNCKCKNKGFDDFGWRNSDNKFILGVDEDDDVYGCDKETWLTVSSDSEL